MGSQVPDDPPRLGHCKDNEKHPRDVHPVDPHMISFAYEATEACEYLRDRQGQKDRYENCDVLELGQAVTPAT